MFHTCIQYWSNKFLLGFELIPEDLANMSDKYYKWSPPDYLRDLTPGPRSMGKTIGERTYWV